MSEWPLVAFTLLVQSSVGVVIFSALFFCRLEKSLGNQRASLAMKPVLLTGAVLGCLGLLASTLHMGYPWNAFHALRHISTSWLSREIVFAALYLGALCLYTLFVLIKGRMNRSILALIGLLGLIDIYCMASLYFSTAMMTWMHVNTYILFFAAVFAAGGTIALGLTALRVKSVIDGTTTLRIVAVALGLIFLAVAVRMAAQPFFLEWLSEAAQNSDAITFPHSPLAAYATTSGLRIIAGALSISGILFLGFSLMRMRNTVLTSGLPVILSGSVLVFAGEVLNRFAFFIVQ
ncbi:dimethyl sulfoxide reductase anchor subunit [Morganella psychrotolerans]|uniref:Dimethyl sulfoxide reductase n=1 Tax=Morganella psychrotolerans TaxID=368603 RepID=A0A5M9R8F3_9GAMM|nr:DmsC/YnfH family molybdoenzyme membrane anchor subunit [Morganella psychrotolerans]KAA8717234.1 dimethyl sulfoxide reductase [Morganella psychrotolerans]OBU08474.1 dimethyl sulfoxide reductase [Morganella psychrotolerans]